MGQVRHGSATTMHAVRAAIQRSQALITELSRELGINPKTVAKWRKRPRRPMVGMMLHQDGSSHEWVPDQWWDLIVTMDDANRFLKEVYLPEHNARLPRSSRCLKMRPRPSSRLRGMSGIRCACRKTVSSATTTRCATRGWSCRSRRTGTAITSSRRRSGSTNTPMATGMHWPLPTRRIAHQAGGEQTESRVTRFDVAPTQQPKSTVACGSLRFGLLRYQLKRTIGMVHQPDNSQCSRQTRLVRVCDFLSPSARLIPLDVEHDLLRR